MQDTRWMRCGVVWSRQVCLQRCPDASSRLAVGLPCGVSLRLTLLRSGDDARYSVDALWSRLVSSSLFAAMPRRFIEVGSRFAVWGVATPDVASFRRRCKILGGCVVESSGLVKFVCSDAQTLHRGWQSVCRVGCRYA